MINIATIFLLGTLLLIMAKCRNLEELRMFSLVGALAFALLVNSGYFLQIGSIFLQYDEFMVLFFLGLSLFTGKLYRIDKTVFFGGLGLIIVVLLGVVMLALDLRNVKVLPIGESWDAFFYGRTYLLAPVTFSTKNIERIIRIIMLVVIGISINEYLRKAPIDAISFFEKAIIMITSVQVLIGALDFCLKFFLQTAFLQQFTAFFFGIAPSQFGRYIVRGGTYAIQGFMREPSHFAMSFLPGIIVLSLSVGKGTKMRLLEILVVGALFFAASFTGFGLICFWLALKIINQLTHWKMMSLLKSSILLLGVFFLCIGLFFYWNHFPLLSYYANRLMGALGFGPSIGSESIRMGSILEMLKLFLLYPILGCGLGSTNAHGFLPSLLANVGILGFISWAFFGTKAFCINVSGNLVPIFVVLFTLTFISDISLMYDQVGISIWLSLFVVTNTRRVKLICGVWR